MNNHHSAVTTETFKNSPNLTEFYTVLSTNMDRKGVEFVSSMESQCIVTHPGVNSAQNR